MTVNILNLETLVDKDYGLVRSWIAGHPLVSVAAALLLGVLIGWL